MSDDTGTDRDQPGMKRHVTVDRKGVPLAVKRTPANTHDGRPRKRPGKRHADEACEFPRCWEAPRRRGIGVRIARRSVEGSGKLGRHRWLVERTLAWLGTYRRLAVRYESRADIREAFLHRSCALAYLNYLPRWF
jgi:transposase